MVHISCDGTRDKGDGAMLVCTPAILENYEVHDTLNQLLESAAQPDDDRFTSYRWLQESMPKRMIFFHLYGDLLSAETEPRSILDVGGGFTPLTRLLVRTHNYCLLDLMAHDSFESIHQEEISLQQDFWINKDWYEFEPPSKYDLLVANDLFPNVDQRLEIFIDRYLPYCREMRLSLTYYNNPRWYKVHRVDADEVLHMLAWDGARLRRTLELYSDRIDSPDFEALIQDCPSLFQNQRQVCLAKLRGDG